MGPDGLTSGPLSQWERGKIACLSPRALPPLMETSLQQTVLMMRGNFLAVFTTRPIAFIFFLLALGFILSPLLVKRRHNVGGATTASSGGVE